MKLNARSSLICIATILLGAAFSLSSRGASVSAAVGLPQPKRVAETHWIGEPTSPGGDVLVGSADDQGARSGGPKYYGAFGLVGVSRRAASYDDLVAFAEQLGVDKCFRELVVRHAAQKDFGIQFVYTGKDVDRSFLSRLIDRFRRRFGRDSLISINASAVITPEPGAKALGVVVFRPME